MSIEEDVSNLEQVKEKLSEAWEAASNTKELFAEAQDLLMSALGPVSNMPQLAGEANGQMEAAKQLCEEAQTNSTGASESIDGYIEQISS